LLSDSDLTTHYYVEACQTLRVAIANLLRGGASRRGADSLKPQLAEHLGIAESRVSKYLAEHCVVRYLQLDDDAAHFAHFVMAVLRPVLNQ
jgi:predicted transcriptional regulator